MDARPDRSLINHASDASQPKVTHLLNQLSATNHHSRVIIHRGGTLIFIIGQYIILFQ